MKVISKSKCEIEPLVSYSPEGLFASKDMKGQRAAIEIFINLEKVICNGVQRVELLTALSNLKPYSRSVRETTEDEEKLLSSNREVTATFHRQLLRFFSPSWYEPLIKILTDEEVETFLKICLVSHEIFGRSAGIALAFRWMLECVTHSSVQVRVEPIGTTLVPVPEHLKTILGKRHSTLGSDFVLGKQFVASSIELHIYVGPIQVLDLEKLQLSGWADGVGSGIKASLLSELLVPYNFMPIIHFVLVTDGFRLGKSRLKRDRLGSVASRGTFEKTIAYGQADMVA